MLCKEIIAAYSENDTKHINTLCRQNSELLNVKAGDTYSYHLIGCIIINLKVLASLMTGKFLSLRCCIRIQALEGTFTEM
jgi:hypothetical protein